MSNTAIMTSVLQQTIQTNQSLIKMMLPAHVNIQKIMQQALLTYQSDESLQRCTPASLFLGIIKAASLGLEISNPLGEAYLLPFYNRAKDAHEAVFVPGYRGLMKLARQDENVKIIHAATIRKHDHVEINEGTPPSLIHQRVVSSEERGEIIGYQANYVMASGEPDFIVLDNKEIAKIMAASPSKSKSVWKQWPEPMGRKSALRQLSKVMPCSINLKNAIAIDTSIEAGNPEASDALFNLEGFELPDNENFQSKRISNNNQNNQAALTQKIQSAVPPPPSIPTTATKTPVSPAIEQKEEEGTGRSSYVNDMLS